MMSLSLLGGFICLSVAIVYLRGFSRRRYKLQLPPGPKGWPIFGNSFDAPKEFEWLKYQQWSTEYDSPVIHLNLSGTPFIVLNTAKAAQDILEKRSSVTSDRATGVMLNDLIGWDFNIAFMGYGERWRAARRAFHQHFRPDAVVDYLPKTTKWVREFAKLLLDKPDDFMEHINQYAKFFDFSLRGKRVLMPHSIPGALIMDIVYGIEVQPKHDPYIDSAEAALQSLAVAGNPGNFLVDTVPALKYLPDWLPGASFKRMAKEWRIHTTAMIERPFNAVKAAIRNRTVTPSVLANMLERLDPYVDNTFAEDCLRAAAATAYSGGSHTTVSVLGSFFLAMVLYPDVQAKARAEIDRIIGRDRLPEFGDEESMPYVSAIVKETWRWRPVLPLGEYPLLECCSRPSDLNVLGAVPHRLIRDDDYMGYYLPAGSLIVGNTWYVAFKSIQTPFSPLLYSSPMFMRHPISQGDPSRRGALPQRRRIHP
ncbi:hypothetical protein NM688_g5274 [Phlebia brevispora]|uniref:Uncharacterized protein n=1 Tax=Phlebia brevispora TaxID=194682 RepID=A0ACC1SXV6_9APHY|nr:hypothetical protein NM688_g5274 [Phlebia brevispora]